MVESPDLVATSLSHFQELTGERVVSVDLDVHSPVNRRFITIYSTPEDSDVELFDNALINGYTDLQLLADYPLLWTSRIVEIKAS